MPVIRPRVDFKFPEHGAAEWAFGQHPFDRSLDNGLGRFLLELLESYLF